MFKKIFKALFYTDDRKHFSRKALMNNSAFTLAILTGITMTALLVVDYIVNKKINVPFSGVVSAYWGVKVLGMAFQYTYGKKLDKSIGTEEEKSNEGSELP